MNASKALVLSPPWLWSMPKLPLAWRVLAMTMAQDTIFYVPVAIAYYELKGADIGGFLFLQGLFRLTMLILEIPTGFLSDRWDRRHQLVASGLFWILHVVILYFSTSYNGLLIAELVAAVGWCLRSGTTEAYLHEGVVASGKPETTSTWQSRLFAGTLVMETVASLVGGWLFSQWVEAPVVATLAFAMLGVWLALGLPQIARTRERRHENPFRDMYLVLRWNLRDHPKVPWLLLGPPALFGCTAVVFWSAQGRLVELGVSPLWLGIAMSSTCLLKAGMAIRTDWLMQRVGQRWIAISLPIGLAIGMAMVAMAPVGWMVWVGGVIGSGAVHAVGRPFGVCLINQEVNDSERATVLSVASLVNTLLSAVLLLASAPLLEHFTLGNVLLVYLAVTLVLAGYPLYRLIQISPK